MKYTTHNQNDLISANGTSLQDAFTPHYSELVAAFGEPLRWNDENSDGKVQAEWIIQFEDGKIGTVYDWKEYGTPVELVRDWHIGGKDQETAARIRAIVGV